MANGERVGFSGDGGAPRRDTQGPAVKNVELTGFPFPEDLGRKIAQLNERGRGRVIGYATGGTPESSTQGHAFMFAIPYRESNRNGGPETEVLLLSPTQEGYRFVVISPKLTEDDKIAFKAMLMPSKSREPFIFRDWRPEPGADPFSEFLRNRSNLVPSIGVEHELTGKDVTQKAFADAIGRTETLAAQSIEVDEAALERQIGDHARELRDLDLIFDADATRMEEAQRGRQQARSEMDRVVSRIDEVDVFAALEGIFALPDAEEGPTYSK
jgi:hypothetical protein